MDEQQSDDTTSDDATEGQPAQTVRVPNVSPNAKSGLDHTIIGANALADAGSDEADPESAKEEPDSDPLPDGDLDAQVQWVADAEDRDTAKARADKVWAAHGGDATEGDDPDSEKAALASRLSIAVYGEPPATNTGDPDNLTGDGSSDAGADGAVIDSPAAEDAAHEQGSAQS